MQFKNYEVPFPISTIPAYLGNRSNPQNIPHLKPPSIPLFFCSNGEKFSTSSLTPLALLVHQLVFPNPPLSPFFRNSIVTESQPRSLFHISLILSYLPNLTYIHTLPSTPSTPSHPNPHPQTKNLPSPHPPQKSGARNPHPPAFLSIKKRIQNNYPTKP